MSYSTFEREIISIGEEAKKRLKKHQDRMSRERKRCLKILREVERRIKMGRDVQHEFPKSIYEMELHEELVSVELSIIRVPGGWIYYYPLHRPVNVFVPFDDEFMKKPEFDSYCGH